jgi:hypothetical protein
VPGQEYAGARGCEFQVDHSHHHSRKQALIVGNEQAWPVGCDRVLVTKSLGRKLVRREQSIEESWGGSASNVVSAEYNDPPHHANVILTCDKQTVKEDDFYYCDCCDCSRDGVLSHCDADDVWLACSLARLESRLWRAG